jgi:hypothetical protein
LVSIPPGDWPPASHSTTTSATRLTSDMASVVAVSPARLRPDGAAPVPRAWTTRLPAAAAAIHWATLKHAFNGWIRMIPSETATATPTATTTSIPDRTRTAGTRIASNRSRALTSSP